MVRLIYPLLNWLMKVPVVYLEIAQRFDLNKDLMPDKISVTRAKRVLGAIYRFNRKSQVAIISDMCYYGVIEYQHRGIKILIKRDT